MFDVITIGGATRDIFFDYNFKEKDFDKIKYLMVPYGEKIVADSSFYTYGGGAYNTAIGFSRLGLKVATVCSIGHEGTGDLIVKNLKAEGVNVQRIHRDRSLHTGLSIFIIGKNSEHTGFLERGANNHLVIKKWSALSSKWFYISSLTGESAKLLPEIFEFARKKNIKIAFNPGSIQLNSGYQYLKEFIPQCEILFLNYEEAEGLFFSKLKKSPKNEKELLLEIEKMGARISVVTEDGHGCHAISGQKIHSTRAYSTQVVDTTGAGDCFGSTFTFGVLRGFDLNYCLKIAAINAASVVGKMGAIDGLLNYNGVKKSKWL